MLETKLTYDAKVKDQACKVTQTLIRFLMFLRMLYYHGVSDILDVKLKM